MCWPVFGSIASLWKREFLSHPLPSVLPGWCRLHPAGGDEWFWIQILFYAFLSLSGVLKPMLYEGNYMLFKGNMMELFCNILASGSTNSVAAAQG